MDTHESCQAGNRAALRGIIHVPQGRRLCGFMGRTILFSKNSKTSFLLKFFSRLRELRGEIFIKGAGPCIRHSTASGGPSPFPRWSVSSTSRIPFSARWLRAARAMPTFSPAPGVPEDHLRPDFGQGHQLPAPCGRRSLQPMRVLPGGIDAGSSWTSPSWMPPATMVWTMFAPSGRRRCIPPRC